MKPLYKKILSSVAVAAAGAALVALNAYVIKLPEGLQGFVGAGLAAAVHYVNAWGTQEQVADKLVSGEVKP